MTRTTETTTETTDPPGIGPATAERGAGRTVAVRTRIALTIAVVTGVAMAAAGLLVYVLESSRIDDNLNQQIEQEIDELRALQRGDDPGTTRPFASVERLLSLYLARNVTDDDEMLATYVDGRLTGWSPNDYGEPLLAEPEYRTVVQRLSGAGGTEVYDSPLRHEVWVTLVQVENERDPGNTGALVIINFADDERSELYRTIQTYGVLTLLFLGVITLLALWRSGQLLAPLTELRRTAEEIGETDLSRRIPERGNDDITALTRTINDMLARLQHAFVGQRQFLDDAGHELRTPLTILQGHLELLDASDPEEVAETRQLLLEEVDRMSRLVGDLVLLAKSDRPDFLTPQPVSVERLTHTLLSKARGLADREWVLDGAGDVVVALDEQRITQAVLQLADNAVKHTAVGDEVGMGSQVVDGVVRIWVRDTGPGVPEADRDHVFERFGRSVVRPGDEGFGLGLSIVRAIVEAHHGHVVVDPDHSPGALFVITLPIAPEVPWPAS